MSAKVIWLFVFVLLYWVYCIYWGWKSAQISKSASDYFVAGRKLSLWVFVLAATATSFSGWTFMGHPGLIYRDGFQYAYASFYAITIPFAGVMFLKRQWMLGKRFGYITPGEMLADYFQGDTIRILVVIVALLFSIPYLGLQLGASGFLLQVLTDDLVSKNFGMWMLSIVVLIYVASGGLRAVAYVGTLQCILLIVGITCIGFVAYDKMGGWESFNMAMAKLGATDIGKWGSTKGFGGGDYNAYFAIPGVIQYTAGLGKQTPIGGLWTSVMVLTYMFALMGIQAAPAFTMWSFGNDDPSSFAPQQVWASSFGIGLILLFFTAAQGMGSHFLGATPEIDKAGLSLGSAIPNLTDNMQGNLVPYFINLFSDSAPWFVGLLAVCALAAVQSTGAAYISTAGGILTRDLYKRFYDQAASYRIQKIFGRLAVIVIVASALLASTFSVDALVLLGGLAVAFGFQMWPSLAAVCWFPWITRQGATLGLAAGCFAVIFTENLGASIVNGLGKIFGIEIELAWGRWPLTIHSAGWGMLFNASICIVVSAMTQENSDMEHRMKYHSFLREHATLPSFKQGLKPVAWIIVLVWLFFGIGPGAVIGNDIFGAPNSGYTEWTFGMPSIWAWQILWWALGVFMMWFLAYKMEMSTKPQKEVLALVDDIGDTISKGNST